MKRPDFPLEIREYTQILSKFPGKANLVGATITVGWDDHTKKVTAKFSVQVKDPATVAIVSISSAIGYEVGQGVYPTAVDGSVQSDDNIYSLHTANGHLIDAHCPPGKGKRNRDSSDYCPSEQ